MADERRQGARGLTGVGLQSLVQYSAERQAERLPVEQDRDAEEVPFRLRIAQVNEECVRILKAGGVPTYSAIRRKNRDEDPVRARYPSESQVQCRLKEMHVS